MAAAAHAAPLVFTAHDLLPRRTARHTRHLAAALRPLRPHRHPQRARPRPLEAFGVAAAKLRVIPHPAFRSEPAARDDGHTVLALGVIRPYKGLDDAVEAVARRPGCAAARGGRSADPARRAPRTRRAIAPSGGSATSARRRSRRARRGDRRRLPVPGRARPVGRAAPGARGRHPGGRLRRRRARRDRRRVRSRAGGCAGRRRRCSSGRFGELLDDARRARRGACGCRGAPATASPGTRAATAHLALYEELV